MVCGFQLFKNEFVCLSMTLRNVHSKRSAFESGIQYVFKAKFVLHS